MAKTVISQSGIFGFGPQASEGVIAPNFYRHKSQDIDLAPIDDARLGPPEIGGVPVPTFPYKVGAMSAGGATIAPRMEDTFGWLLYGALGDVSTSGSGTGGVSYPEFCLPRVYLTSSAKTVTSKISNPPQATTLIVRAWRDGASNVTGNVTIHGTTSGSDTSEIVALDDRNEVETTKTWVTITSVELPVQVNADGFDSVSIGWAASDFRKHAFQFLASDAYYVPWMSFRKLIPAGRNNVTFGEQFVDSKVIGLNFQLSTENPIVCRVDAMGKAFDFVDDPANNWTWANTYEDYTSIPIGCTPGGYIRVPSFGDQPLPITAATVGIQNGPLDPAQIRNYGDWALDDVPIITRQLVFDVTCKWYDPSLYRAIQTNSKTGLTWSPIPFVQSLAITGYAPYFPTGSVGRYGLEVLADSVMWQLNGGVRLAGNDLVTMRLTGTAIDTTGVYASFNLINKKESYVWPT
jgi:hypothetical protein